ncbi:MAG: aminotransferase class I and II [Muribaculaceae bacterium]|nr:aminotransferase class I and II [Muribaculaceae bacterium]
MEIRKQNLTRYITPLREGGSLPALAEADDGFKYVVKFRGSGHREKALIADFLGGEIARAIGLRVPEQVFLNLDEYFGQAEGDEEIQDLLKWSQGLNLGVHYLQGAMTLDPYANPVDEATASRIVWLDMFITNVDRTVKNTNMLIWNRELWLIDHGASFYFHHSWSDWEKSAMTQFPYIKDHALLHKATRMREVDREIRSRLTEAKLDEIVDALPDEWLNWDDTSAAASSIFNTENADSVDNADDLINERREVYRKFLHKRLRDMDIVKAVEDARAKQI